MSTPKKPGAGKANGTPKKRTTKKAAPTPPKSRPNAGTGRTVPTDNRGRTPALVLCATCRQHPTDVCPAATSDTPAKCVTVHDRIVALLATGVSRAATCNEVGVGESTLRLWEDNGRTAAGLEAEGYDLTDGEHIYLRFLRDSTRARARLEIRVTRRLSALVDDPDTDVRDLIDILQRISRERWARQDTLSVEHGGTVTVDLAGRFAPTIAAVLRDVLGSLNLSDEQRERAPDVVKLALERHSSSNPEGDV